MLEGYFTPEQRSLLWIDSYNQEQAEALMNVLLYQYSIGQHKDLRISEVKYDGKLIILDDMSRWEVDSSDSYQSDTWLPDDQVVVIYGEMFKLDEFEKVQVTEEID